jgi:hypothetical protein
MQVHTHLGKSLFGKAALATVALGGLFFLAGAPKAQAADRDDGERRNSRTEYRLHDVYDRNYYNGRASEWRHERYERQDRFRSRDDRYRDWDRYQRRYDRDRD